MPRKYGIAGMMELADVPDSKSTSPLPTALAETLDFARLFENRICNLVLMSLHDVPPFSRMGHREMT